MYFSQFIIACDGKDSSGCFGSRLRCNSAISALARMDAQSEILHPAAVIRHCRQTDTTLQTDRYDLADRQFTHYMTILNRPYLIPQKPQQPINLLPCRRDFLPNSFPLMAEWYPSQAPFVSCWARGTSLKPLTHSSAGMILVLSAVVLAGQS